MNEDMRIFMSFSNITNLTKTKKHENKLTLLITPFHGCINNSGAEPTLKNEE